MDCNCMKVRRASRAITQFYDDALKSSGLTVAQFGLLWNVSSGAATTISELAKKMRIDRTTLNRNLKPLLTAGLITINPGKDSRTRQISLTESGKAAVVSARELWEEAQSSLMAYLGEDDLITLVKLMSKLEEIVPE